MGAGMTTLTLQALEAAFSSIESVGKGELAFDVDGTPVVIRVIPPEEEALVHKQVTDAVEQASNPEGDDSGNQHRALTYINEIKIGTVAHAIVEIDGLDLRGSPHVETGETLANGTAVKVARAEAIRKIMRQREWSGTLLAMMFRKYGELLSNVDREAESAVVFEPSDRPAEIERLKNRLGRLEELEKTEKEEGKKALGSELSQQVRDLASAENQDARQKGETLSHLAAGDRAEPEPEEEVSPQVLPPAARPPDSAASSPRQPITPRRAAPPVVTSTAPSIPTPPAPPVQQQEVLPAPVEDTSFINTSDPESVRAAVDAENERLLRARMGRDQTPQPESVLTAARAIRKPPHLDAREVADSNFLEGEVIQGQGSAPATLKRPVEELGRPQAVSQQAPVKVNTPSKGGVNPRFKPSGSQR
jgi:hypothetical protein